MSEGTGLNRKKIKRGLILAMAILLALAGMFVGGMIFQNRKAEPAEPVITVDHLAQEITAISQYATLEYRYTNVGKFEDRVDFYGWNIPFSAKNFIITYDGAMKLGINGRDIHIEQQGETILITLPPIQVLSHEIREDTLEVLDQSKNIFNQIEISDYTSFAADQKLEMEQKARANGLFEEAMQNAETQMRSFLAFLPGLDEEYTVLVQRGEA